MKYRRPYYIIGDSIRKYAIDGPDASYTARESCECLGYMKFGQCKHLRMRRMDFSRLKGGKSREVMKAVHDACDRMNIPYPAQPVPDNVQSVIISVPKIEQCVIEDYVDFVIVMNKEK